MYGVLLTGTLTDLTFYMMLTERDMISVERVSEYFSNESELPESKLLKINENGTSGEENNSVLVEMKQNLAVHEDGKIK
jgi:hypothetical protein